MMSWENAACHSICHGARVKHSKAVLSVIQRVNGSTMAGHGGPPESTLASIAQLRWLVVFSLIASARVTGFTMGDGDSLSDHVSALTSYHARSGYKKVSSSAL